MLSNDTHSHATCKSDSESAVCLSDSVRSVHLTPTPTPINQAQTRTAAPKLDSYPKLSGSGTGSGIGGSGGTGTGTDGSGTGSGSGSGSAANASPTNSTVGGDCSDENNKWTDHDPKCEGHSIDELWDEDQPPGECDKSEGWDESSETESGDIKSGDIKSGDIKSGDIKSGDTSCWVYTPRLVISDYQLFSRRH